MFQKFFQKCISRFWVMRSNSAPLSSGSTTYFPEVMTESAALPINQNGNLTESWETTAPSLVVCKVHDVNTERSKRSAYSEFGNYSGLLNLAQLLSYRFRLKLHSAIQFLQSEQLFTIHKTLSKVSKASKF